MAHLFASIKAGFEELVEKAEDTLGMEKHSHTHIGEACGHLHTRLTNMIEGTEQPHHRYESFAPESQGDVKWYVDGCGYFWAVSVALEEAKDEIWILDWWLSPELYLRRPPSANEQYRLDRMLKAAAERGVKVNIIVYKEVTQALTTCSYHTKHALEELHPNICVFRHPDHLPDGQVFESELVTSFKKNMSMGVHELAALPGDGLKALFGVNNDVVLYWAHHEKLLLVDRKLAFMGGLDLCFGRWDTNNHPIADAHPENLDDIVFPGQDFNNARIYDFQNVTDWSANKLDRTKSSRMGWSDCSISLQGSICEDLTDHFVTRWNFIYNEKYDVRKDDRYSLLAMVPSASSGGLSSYLPGLSENVNPGEHHRHHHGGIFDNIQRGFNHMRGQEGEDDMEQNGPPAGNTPIQLVRSCTKWSNGVPTEHSIANAYIETIRNSKHFIYIENQFFITATSEEQSPVKNKIGAAIVERILRAYRNGERYKAIILIPSVPAFAGNLEDDASLGTRAIMEYQYSSICRGGYSIIEMIKKGGVENPEEYIRFYNLRNFDRINTSSDMKAVEQESGVNYETARKEHDDKVGAGYNGDGEDTGVGPNTGSDQYDRYQEGARAVNDGSPKWDSISGTYMLNGTPLSKIPWKNGDQSEIDAFVSEELYIHTKVLIADDRVVICGSANLNDRSQLGYHDSEICVVIEDPTPIETTMAGQPFTASKFATSLRRQMFRKHIGLLPYQDFTHPTANFVPINKAPNTYDWGSHADKLVADPFSIQFEKLWYDVAATNTYVFAKAFHCVPADNVTNWDQYKSFFSDYFVVSEDDKKKGKTAKYEYGHVVREEFENVDECRELLGRVRGTLVEMPLKFLEGVDMAKEGLAFNGFTAEVYT